MKQLSSEALLLHIAPSTGSASMFLKELMSEETKNLSPMKGTLFSKFPDSLKGKGL